jgi:excisionase family DNA binding protein
MSDFDQMTGSDERFFTIAVVAEMLAVSERWVRRRIAMGELPAHRMGKLLATRWGGCDRLDVPRKLRRRGLLGARIINHRPLAPSSPHRDDDRRPVAAIGQPNLG